MSNSLPSPLAPVASHSAVASQTQPTNNYQHMEWPRPGRAIGSNALPSQERGSSTATSAAAAWHAIKNPTTWNLIPSAKCWKPCGQYFHVSKRFFFVAMMLFRRNSENYGAKLPTRDCWQGSFDGNWTLSLSSSTITDRTCYGFHCYTTLITLHLQNTSCHHDTIGYNWWHWLEPLLWRVKRSGRHLPVPVVLVQIWIGEWPAQHRHGRAPECRTRMKIEGPWPSRSIVDDFMKYHHKYCNTCADYLLFANMTGHPHHPPSIEAIETVVPSIAISNHAPGIPCIH